MKKVVVFAIVLALVVSCTCAFAFSWKQWGKDFGAKVEKAAEDYAEAVEANAELEDGNLDVAGDFLKLTDTFIGSIFGAFSAK